MDNKLDHTSVPVEQSEGKSQSRNKNRRQQRPQQAQATNASTSARDDEPAVTNSKHRRNRKQNKDKFHRQNVDGDEEDAIVTDDVNETQVADAGRVAGRSVHDLSKGSAKRPKSAKKGQRSTASSASSATTQSLNVLAPIFVPKNYQSVENTCIICTNPLRFCAIGQCDHEICSLCALRLRIKNKDKGCAICKQELPYMVVYDMASEGRKSFASFDVHEDAPQPGIDVEHQSNLYFVNCSKHFSEMCDKRSIICPVAGCTGRFAIEAHLVHHLKSAHALYMCSLCLANRPLFIPEQQLYTKSQLNAHLNAPPGSLSGAGGDKTAGHPMCRFCNERFYDSPALYKVLDLLSFALVSGMF